MFKNEEAYCLKIQSNFKWSLKAYIVSACKLLNLKITKNVLPKRNLAFIK